MDDLKATVDDGMDTREGSLIDHSFRGAAAEFEKAYIGIALADQNGYAETADREHLILRAMEKGITPLKATCAIWKAVFNVEIPEGARFSAAGLSYICTGETEDGAYRLQCEQDGTKGNIKQEGLSAVEYIDGFESGELTELLVPARDEEDTETFRARYLSIAGAAQAFGGNRAQYRAVMHKQEGVGACKIYRVTQGVRRIKIYFLDSAYKVPSDELVADIQEIIDPVSRQGEGEGEAPIFHVVDILPCTAETINVEADITIDTGYIWEDLLPAIQKKIDAYFSELARGWEGGQYITVRVLKINQAVAGVEGIVDIQNTMLNGAESNLFLDQNAVPVRGDIICRN